jgi:hypothetical protein
VVFAFVAISWFLAVTFKEQGFHCAEIPFLPAGRCYFLSEKKLDKVTEVEKMFCCSSVFGRARYAADSSAKAGSLPACPAEVKAICYRFVS